jgi:parvulin-like peptidyl-prolyl isomerase
MEAAQSVVSQAVLAEAARTRFASTGLLEVCERSAHARALLDRLFELAKAAGPPTDQEIDALKAERWMDLDRPSSVSVAHAVVVAKGSAEAASARASAERIARATAGISDVSKFIKVAKAVATKPLEKRVEQLPHMTADGRAVYLDPFDPRRERPLQFDLAFAAAVHAIPEEGQQSPVVETKFGYHVILMVERIDPQHMSRAEFRRELEPDVFQARAKRQLDSLLSDLRSKATVELARNLEELTEQVSQRP